MALRYGASHYAVYRSHDDRYKFLQIADFENKADWVAYWNGPEMIRFRTLHSGWFQVPGALRPAGPHRAGECPLDAGARAPTPSDAAA